MFSTTVILLVMSVIIISITIESDILISCWRGQDPQFSSICIFSSGKWGWYIIVSSLLSGYKEQVRAREALSTIFGAWLTESAQWLLAARHLFMHQALGIRNTLLAILLSFSQLPIHSIATLTHCWKVSDGDHMTSQVSHPVFEHLLGLEEFSRFCLEIMWKKISYQLISAISTISVIQAQAERVYPFTVWQPAKYLKTALTSLLSIFAIRLNISSSFTLLSHNTIPQPLTLLIALSWTYSRFPVVTPKYVTWPAFSTPDAWWVHLPHSGLLPTSFWCSLLLLSYPRLAVALSAAPSGLFMLFWTWIDSHPSCSSSSSCLWELELQIYV